MTSHLPVLEYPGGIISRRAARSVYARGYTADKILRNRRARSPRRVPQRQIVTMFMHARSITKLTPCRRHAQSCRHHGANARAARGVVLASRRSPGDGRLHTAPLHAHRHHGHPTISRVAHRHQMPNDTEYTRQSRHRVAEERSRYRGEGEVAALLAARPRAAHVRRLVRVGGSEYFSSSKKKKKKTSPPQGQSQSSHHPLAICKELTASLEISWNTDR